MLMFNSNISSTVVECFTAVCLTSRRGICLAIALTLLLISAGEASAQRASGRNEPGQIERRIRDRDLPEAPADADESRVRAPLIPPGEVEEPLRFVLGGVAVEGATAFAAADFAPAYRDFLNKDVGAAEVELMLKRITGLYRENGYFLSTAVARPQDVGDGILRIQIIEGYVENVVFQSEGRDRPGPRRYFRNVVNERPLTLATVERAVLLLNDEPGIEATASMRPLAVAPGAYELIVEIDDSFADGSFFLNNWGTRAVGPLQAWLSGGLNAPLGLDGRVQAGVFTVPNQPKELLYGELAYIQPIGASGTYASLTGALARIEEGDGSAVDSTSGRLTLRTWHPLIRSQRENLWLNGAFEYFNLDEDMAGEATAQDRLRVLRAGFNYWRADGLGGNSFLVGEISQGLPVLGASSSNSAELTTFKGRSDFTKVSLQASREQGVSDDVGLQLSLSGQKSFDRLLSSEQFSYGGSQFGRAYDFAEISGDDGLAAGVELRFGRSVKRSWLEAFQLFANCDVGVVWNDYPGAGTVRDSLAAVGGGVRLTFPGQIRAVVEFGKGLAAFDGTAGSGGSRVSFSLSTDL